jgi:hypothetical protein
MRARGCHEPREGTGGWGARRPCAVLGALWFQFHCRRHSSARYDHCGSNLKWRASAVIMDASFCPKCLLTCLPALSQAHLPPFTPLLLNLGPFIESSTTELLKNMLVLIRKPHDSWIATLDIGSSTAQLTTYQASSILVASTCCCWAKAETVLRCSTREIVCCIPRSLLCLIENSLLVDL